jgi:inositol phosphorylceramide mannosyltransferase catalytic subunit
MISGNDSNNISDEYRCFNDKRSTCVIPKIIMQTWKTDELPEKWKPTQESINRYMSDWKYILMTDEMNRNFILKYFEDFIRYYDNFSYPIQRADAIRYAWMYINGGLYLDCDFELLGSLEELFTEEHDLFLLASSNTPNIITNGFIAAKPRNKIFLEMMEEMKKSPGIYSIEKHLLVMNTTGPLAFNRVVKRSKISYKLLPSSKLNPYTICDNKYENPDTLMRPLEGSSWIDQTGQLYQKIYCLTTKNKNHIISVSIFIIGLIILVILVYFNIIR